jgi:uncharacterized protein (TIGR04255 family)
VSDPGLLIQVQEGLGQRYPDANPFEQQEVVFSAGPGGANATTKQSQQGWQLKSDDGSWTTTLQTDFFSLETSAYTDWSDFRQRFGEILETVDANYGPKLEQRIGLRYVDEIERTDLDGPYAWRERIEDTILGPAADAQLGPSVRVAQQILELEGPDSTRALLRSGCEPANGGKSGSVYRLDHDCFRQRSRPFDTASILDTIDGLHRMALQLFQKAITASMYEELKGLDVSE